MDKAAKTRALTAQEKSLLSSREAILNAAKVVDQKNREVEAQQKINGLAQQANKYVTQMSEKTDALRDSAGLSSRQTQRMMEEAQLRQGWLNGGGKLEDAGYEKELAALRKYYAEEDKLRGDWKAGAVSGWNEYLDAATNTYDAVKNVASSTLTGLSNMLTELMTTGTASVKEFGKSMLKMILEITNQLIVAYTVQAAMGWISGGSKGGSTPGGSYANAAAGLTFNAKGGVYDSPGLSKYVNGVYDSPQYFTFQGRQSLRRAVYSQRLTLKRSCHWQKILPEDLELERKAVGQWLPSLIPPLMSMLVARQQPTHQVLVMLWDVRLRMRCRTLRCRLSRSTLSLVA